MLNNDGDNIWTSPASFKASCDVQVAMWPFDTQNCSLYFGSMSDGKEAITLNDFDTKTRGGKGPILLTLVINGNNFF